MQKNKIAAAFNKAVKSYDQTAIVQQTIAAWLLQELSAGQKFEHVLDVGCGTGYLTNKLADLFPASKVYGVDFATKMIAYAKCNYDADNLEFLCADIENMPFDNCFAKLVFSNCVFQWASNFELMLNEIKRILCKDGKLFFSTFTRGTLTELESVCESTGKQHVNSFKTVAAIRKALMKSGFTGINLATESIVLQFNEMKDLMYYLKKLGTNYVADRDSALMGKNTFAKLSNLYKARFSVNGKITATFMIVYGYACRGGR